MQYTVEHKIELGKYSKRGSFKATVDYYTLSGKRDFRSTLEIVRYYMDMSKLGGECLVTTPCGNRYRVTQTDCKLLGCW